MKQIGNTLYADSGKWLVRKADGFVYGNEIVLGYTYYIGGELQDPPHKDEPSDFGEIAESEVADDTKE